MSGDNATRGCCVRVTDGPDRGISRALGRSVVVGRDELADLRLSDTSVSRRHLELSAQADGIQVIDLGSSSGTFVGDERVDGSRRSHPGAVLRLGRTELRVLRVVRAAEFEGPRLVVKNGSRAGQVLPIDRPVTLGRDPRQCQIELRDPSVSGVHCSIEQFGQGLRLENRSRLGTDVNGQLFSGVTTVGPGDIVRLGDVELLVEISDRAESSDTAVEIDIDVEGVLGTQSIVIETGSTATVGDVASMLGARLKVVDRVFLYRAHDGLCPDSNMLWRRVPIGRADSWILGVGVHPIEFNAHASECEPAPYVRSVARPPRQALPTFDAQVTLPPLPPDDKLRGAATAWQVAGGLTAVMGSVIIAQLRPAFAVFAYVMAGTAVLGLAVGVLGQRSRRRAEQRVFKARVVELRGDLVDEVRRQRLVREATWPPTAHTAAWAVSGDERMWERRPGDPDMLDLRIATADLPALIDVQQQPGRWDNAAARAEVTRLISDHSVLQSVPYVVAGDRHLVTGIVGEFEQIAGIGRALLMQVAGLHTPDDVVVFVLATSHQWRWARWLPHATSNGSSTVSWDDNGLDRVCDELANMSSAAQKPRRIFVLVAPGLGVRPKVMNALSVARGGDANIVLLAVEHQQLQIEVGALIDVRGVPMATEQRSAGGVTLAAVESLGAAEAERAGRALARYKGAGSTAAAGRVDACELWRLAPDSFDVVARWQERDSLGPVTFGRDDTGSPTSMDFRDGSPHGVVAGTTGSGKSELLKTVVLGLCVEHRPSQLSLFLMDFKGGSTFNGLSDLPHVVGMVTDLANDRTLVERAFQALDAEIRRRKAVLDQYRLPDIMAYEALAVAHEPMPALVVLIDEFALLKELHPDLVPRLDTIAMQGRSLGIHLLLATQDPQQVITQAIRANTGLWLCLRVAAADQSKQLLGSDAAAQIPFRAPGRGYLRIGADAAITAFQTARITTPHLGDQPSVSVRLLDEVEVEPEPAEQSTSDATVLDIVADRVRAAAHVPGCWLPSPLWLPPLSESVHLDQLESRLDDLGSALAVVVGVVDEPDVPAQTDLVLDFVDAGHVLAVGRFGSGKSTLLRVTAAALCQRYRPDELHVYVIDGGDGSLSALEPLPHVGAVVGVHDSERLSRLLRRLGRELDRRRMSMAADAAAGFQQWRSRPDVEAPWITLLIDEIGALREFLDKNPDQSMYDTFQRLLQSGPAVGVHLLLTASQMTDARAQIANLCGMRLAFELADASDASFVIPGLRRRDGSMPSGRANITSDPPRLAQVANIGPVAEWACAGESSGSSALPIRRLPADISLAEVAEALDGMVIGLGGDEVQPIGLDQLATTHLLVLGESGTGRTTALQTIVASSLRVDRSRVVTVIAERGVWPSGVSSTTWSEELASPVLAQVLEATDPQLVVVDDAERLPRPVAELVGAIARNIERRDIRLVVAGRAMDIVRSYDDWLRYLVSLRHALLLSPSADIESGFDLRPARVRPAPVPGRGLLVSRSGAVQIHVARSEPSAVLQPGRAHSQ